MKSSIGSLIFGALLSSLFIAGVFAYADLYSWYVFLISPLIMGFTGGMIAWEIISKMKLETTWWAALAGGLNSLYIFFMYRYSSYLLLTNKIGIKIDFLPFTVMLAEGGVSLFQLPGLMTGIKLNTMATWWLWAIEIVLAILSGAYFCKTRESNLNL